MRRRRIHRNPRGLGGFSVRGVTSALIPAAIGGAGALALDIGMAYLPLPDMFKTGWGKTVAQILGAIGLGLIAGKVVGREKGKAVAAGALTVVAYNAIRGIAASTLGTSVKGLSGLADFQDYSLGAYMRPGQLGAYMNPAPMLSNGGGSLRTRALAGLGASDGSWNDNAF